MTRGRAATDDEATPLASAASEPVGAPNDAPQGASGLPANGAGDDAKTAVLGPVGGETPVGPVGGDAAAAGETAVAADPGRDLPAGVDATELSTVSTSARRGQVRRRLRYLRAVREILLRDLGGFYLEAQRSEQGADAHRRLLDAKAARLTTLETELRELEVRLEEPHATTVLREPGIGGTCPHCGELHSSEARFCARCGQPLQARAARRTATTPSTPAHEDAKATTASLWGRPKRPDPAPPTAGAIAAPAPAPPAPDEAAAGDAAAGDAAAGDAAAGDAAAGEAADGQPAADAPAPTRGERA
jgi:hypothetical protein